MEPPRLVLNIDGTITGTFRTIHISEIGEIGFGIPVQGS
jgi:hypothetical protein